MGTKLSRDEVISIILKDTEYSENSPTGLMWTTPKRGRKLFSAAGYPDKDGYYVVVIQKIAVRAHRIILMKHGVTLKEGDLVDHVDGNIKNNKIDNLRVVDRKLNGRNTKKICTNTSGEVGVSYDKYGDRWTAFWRDCNTGLSIRQHFPISAFGAEGAFLEAKKRREEAIAEMNKIGAGYTERHGKSNG